MQLYPLKLVTLVTIVTEQILKDQIAKKVIELGAAGCTWQEAQGTGSRGSRRDAVAGGNVQIEVICPQGVAEAILTYVSHHYFDNYACLAWVTDVSVDRGARYDKSGG